ncbi:MAG: hypothetical protein DHS20C19_10080 [Acidimicrobiales bacterium]|nr:MAG: hypothetical protein DHS20C19_10080 [Acidimicrobiales bacterium]
MTEDWLSAHLDGELSAAERAEVDAALAADPVLAADYADLQRVRSLLRSGAVEPAPGAMDRIVAAVDAADRDAPAADVAPVLRLRRRRRVPTVAAAAAAMVIIASVVGGVGGTESLPAIGDLVAQHEVAAAVVEGAPMPDDMMAMAEMPMDDAMAAAPPMPEDLAMTHAFTDGPTMHLVYVTSGGEPISVFRHEGDADVEAFGAGSVVKADEASMWSAPHSGAYVAVIDGTGYVWFVVSAEPHEAMMDDMMHDLPSRSPSLGERLRDAADVVAEPFRFWE